MPHAKSFHFGHRLICRSCRHRDGEMLSHPAPCSRVFWDGPKHHVPVVDDMQCDHFVPAEETAGATT